MRVEDGASAGLRAARLGIRGRISPCGCSWVRWILEVRAGGEAVGTHDRPRLDPAAQRDRAARGQRDAVPVAQAGSGHANLVHEDAVPVFLSHKDPRRALPRRALPRKRFLNKRFTILPYNAAKHPMLSERSASSLAL